MHQSEYMKKAKAIIESVKGQALSMEERREKSIELAASMQNEARRTQSNFERQLQNRLARMMNDPEGKVFSTQMADQCFRTNDNARVADQMIYLIKRHGIPKFLTFDKRLGLRLFKIFGKVMPNIVVPLARALLRKETGALIIPGEQRALTKHMNKRRKEKVRVNLNHLGEAILGEEEAEKRMKTYLQDLERPEIEYISVKVSTIYSQLNILSWDQTVDVLAERLKILYRKAASHQYVRPDGSVTQKFVNLDMEEYRDLHLTVAVFRKVLDDPEFLRYSAGIVLQSYLPDSYLILQELTLWAMQRVASGGAPIKIRIVKGANLAMEQVEASMHNWPQAPFPTKGEVDANYKRMLLYAFKKDHAEAANIGIGSHNLFDIAFALILRAENRVEKDVCFEMLEGMAESMRRVVQELSGDMLLYCPAATAKEFQNAFAYLLRRLDENTAPDNFLRHAFELMPETREWERQASMFSMACHSIDKVGYTPRRKQNRTLLPNEVEKDVPFENDSPTDWSLIANRKWAKHLLEEWLQKDLEDVPVVVGGKEKFSSESVREMYDPSHPQKRRYQYTLGSQEDAEKALETASKAQEKWQSIPVEKRLDILFQVAKNLRIARGSLIGAMAVTTGKVISEADIEVSEAIDFTEYYPRTMKNWLKHEDIQWKPKGTALVTPPWNFPCAIPCGSVVSALAAGNTVIFKPAPESVYVAWLLAKAFWDAGISKEVLQFIPCEDDSVGSFLVKDPRVNFVVLTGATQTAKKMLRMRPSLDLIAETGGKNAIIVSNMSDRDLAIKDLIGSAFGHAGQKCSACSLAILEKEVYDDPHFLKTLKDAASSLKVGPAWDRTTRISPLIHEPNAILKRGLTQLDEGESWLLEPKQDPNNPNLWSPGIKLGVKPGSFMHQNELFGPVLAVMRAENLDEAIKIANGTPYGLTGGIHSLDEREQKKWMNEIEVGNAYVNRGITGAIVRRQPFGGTKASSFGLGLKAGGPNTLVQMMVPKQIGEPSLKAHIPEKYHAIGKDLKEEEKQLLDASLGSYLYFWKTYFNKKHDPSLVLGQDNFLVYKPHKQVLLRVQKGDLKVDVLRSAVASDVCKTPLEISVSPEVKEEMHLDVSSFKGLENVSLVEETEEELINRLAKVRRIRLLSESSMNLKTALAEHACNVSYLPLMSNGRVELLNYLREVSISIDYHRYGYLGEREGEKRKALQS